MTHFCKRALSLSLSHLETLSFSYAFCERHPRGHIYIIQSPAATHVEENTAATVDPGGVRAPVQWGKQAVSAAKSRC